MKYFVIFFVLFGCIVFVPQVFGVERNLFEGTSSFERLPDTIIPGTVYEFELKFQITDSPYWLHGMSPIVDISPKKDASSVHVNFEKIPSGFLSIHRVPVTLYVDQNISSEKIFLSISFASENSSGDEMRSSWSESTILNISSLPLSAELPSSQDYEFATISGASCIYDSSVCFGMFHNGTTIPIQCDYRHSCGIVSFDKKTYKYEEKSPLKQFKLGIPTHEIECKELFVLIVKHDGSPACVKLESVTKLIERDWARNEYYPFGMMGPIMSQESCNDYVISQWQPTFEGREMAQQFLEICIQRGFATPELVERGKIADNFTYGPIQTAKRSAEGDIEKTIENLEETREDHIKYIVHVDVDKEEYHTGDVVIISGYVEGMMPNAELNITVRNPLMDVVLVSQVTISEDGAFAESLPIDDPLWKQNGTYLVSVYYNKATDHTDFLYLSDLESDDLL